MTKRVQRYGFLSTAILLLLAAYFLLLRPHAPTADRSLDTLQWPERFGRLRQRSNYHDWRPSSADWMKRSLLGKFVFVFADEEDPAANKTASIRKALKSLAKQHWPEAINFVSVSSKEYMSSFNNIVGEDFLPNYWPGALMLDVGGGFRKFHVPMHEVLQTQTAFLDEALTHFLKEEVLQKYFQHELKPYLRNEVIEDEDYQGQLHLRHVNSTYFHEILLKKKAEQEFMILFHAPWCGHCRRFEAAFSPLVAQVRSATKRIGFYKVDATKNDIDHPEISLLRVPYIRFFTARDNFKHPVPFDHRTDNLDLKQLKHFFSEHSEYSQEMSGISAGEL